MMTALARMLLGRFGFERVDRWRWDLTRVARGAFIAFAATVLAGLLVWEPLVWPAALFLFTSVASFGFAGLCLLEVERREAAARRQRR